MKNNLDNECDKRHIICLFVFFVEIGHGVVSGGASLLDVALSLGYRSEAAFAKAFKKVLGVTPGEVRRQ